MCYLVFTILQNLTKGLVMDKNNGIVINSDGVQTNDVRGYKYYRGYLQRGLNTVQTSFAQAKNFWAQQLLNGQPLQLKALCVQTAANNTIPYNSASQNHIAPVESSNLRMNRVVWYNVKFETGETGWICNKMYSSVADASMGAAADILHQIYQDKKVIACIREMMAHNR